MAFVREINVILSFSSFLFYSIPMKVKDKISQHIKIATSYSSRIDSLLKPLYVIVEGALFHLYNVGMLFPQWIQESQSMYECHVTKLGPR